MQALELYSLFMNIFTIVEINLSVFREKSSKHAGGGVMSVTMTTMTLTCRHCHQRALMALSLRLMSHQIDLPADRYQCLHFISIVSVSFARRQCVCALKIAGNTDENDLREVVLTAW